MNKWAKWQRDPLKLSFCECHMESIGDIIKCGNDNESEGK